MPATYQSSIIRACVRSLTFFDQVDTVADMVGSTLIIGRTNQTCNPLSNETISLSFFHWFAIQCVKLILLPKTVVDRGTEV